MPKYDIQYCGKPVGTIAAEREGLYMRFAGAAILPQGHIYRLSVQFEDVSIDLGVLLMDGNHFGINAKVPSKRMGSGEPLFCVTSTEEKKYFIEMDEHKPFEYLSALPGAVLGHNGDRRGILIKGDQGATPSAVTESQ